MRMAGRMVLVSERWESRFLPVDELGRSYVTGSMAIEQPQILELVERTADAWYLPMNQDAWVAKEPGEIAVRYCVREWEWQE